MSISLFSLFFSIIQEKALYKRNPESLDRIIELALTAISDEQFEISKEILNYIIETTQDLTTLLTAHQYVLDIDTKTSPKNNLENIKKDFNALFNTYGLSEITLELQLAYGKFLAFYLDQPDQAIDFLRQTLKLHKIT